MILLFFLLKLCIAIPYNDYKLNNKDFNVIMSNNGFTLNNKFNIKYENFIIDNKYKKINFNDFNFNKEYSFSTVSTKMDNINFVYEMSSNNTILLNRLKKVTKYEDNKLYVSIYLNDFIIKDNEFDFKFSIDNSFLINNQSIGINDEFIIDFPEDCIIDGYDERIYLTKYSQKYTISFPSFKHNLYYQFVISYKNKTNNFKLFIFAIFILIGLLFVLHYGMICKNKYNERVRRNNWRY